MQTSRLTSSDTRVTVSSEKENKVTHLISIKTGQSMIIPDKDRVGTLQEMTLVLRCTFRGSHTIG